MYICIYIHILSVLVIVCVCVCICDICTILYMYVCNEWISVPYSKTAPPVSDRSAAAEDDVSLRGLVAGNSAT